MRTLAKVAFFIGFVLLVSALVFLFYYLWVLQGATKCKGFVITNQTLQVSGDLFKKADGTKFTITEDCTLILNGSVSYKEMKTLAVETHLRKSIGWNGNMTFDACEIMEHNNNTNGRRLDCLIGILDFQGCPIKANEVSGTSCDLAKSKTGKTKLPLGTTEFDFIFTSDAGDARLKGAFVIEKN